MKTYSVTMKYTAYTNFEIEAESEEEAEKLALEELRSDGSYGSYGEWIIDELEEMK